MSHIVTLSGWGQRADALDIIAPGATHVDYSHMALPDEVFATLQTMKCDTLIGWSLGGQLALRAIAAGAITPKNLVLLGTPFQFLTRGNVKCGTDPAILRAFSLAFSANPAATLKEFASLVAKNDNYTKEIIKALNPPKEAANWLFWLEELGRFSCQDLNFTNMPRTLIIHGRNDAVVDVAQAGLFLPFIAHSTVKLLDDCGHAPHLHDGVLVRKLIQSLA